MTIDRVRLPKWGYEFGRETGDEGASTRVVEGFEIERGALRGVADARSGDLSLLVAWYGHTRYSAVYNRPPVWWFREFLVRRLVAHLRRTNVVGCLVVRSKHSRIRVQNGDLASSYIYATGVSL